MKISEESVRVHYNSYSRSGFTLRENESDMNEYRGVEYHRIQRPRVSQSRRMLKNHQRIVLSPHRRLSLHRLENVHHRRESPDRRYSPLRESPDRRDRACRQEVLQQLETLQLSEESPRRNHNSNPFIRDSVSPFKRYRSNQSPFRPSTISRERSLTPLIRQSLRQSDDERERSHRHYTPTRHYRRQKSYRSDPNPFRRISHDRSLTPLIRQSPRRSDDERERGHREYSPTRQYRRQKSYRTNPNPFRRISHDRSLTPLIRQSQRQSDDEREQSLTRRQYSPPRRYAPQLTVRRSKVRLLIRRPHKSQLLAYSRKISKLRILRRSASKALSQSLTGEIRALTKLSRAVRGLPLNRNKYKKRAMIEWRQHSVQHNQEDESDEACLNEPDVFEFLD